MQKHLFFFLFLSAFILSACQDSIPNTRASFQFTIENLSANEFATPLSSGVLLLKKEGFPLFQNDMKALENSLSELAEDGNPTTLINRLQSDPTVLMVERFGNILSGESVSIEFEAEYGTFCNFASMFVQSNDSFYSFDEDGIHLFEPNGEPISGNFTQFVWLWDVGTEQNQAPYIGNFQPIRQAFRGEGVEEDGIVQLVNDGFSYPAKTSIIRITISSTTL